MIKQHNIFTGKIDLITDPDDNRARVALALYELQSQAGKVYGAHQPAPKKQKSTPKNQVNLF